MCGCCRSQRTPRRNGAADVPPGPTVASMWSNPFDPPATPEQLRARLDPWSGYDTSAGARPVVVFDEEHADNRELFWSAYEQRDRDEDDWLGSVDLETWARNAVRAADPDGHLSDRSPHATFQSTVARWTDPRADGVAAVAVLSPGVRHPLMLLDESRLPPLLRVRTPTLMSWLHRPDAYLQGDGSTVEVCFTGHEEAAVAYDEPEVLETPTAVTFTAAGRVLKDVEMVHDVGAHDGPPSR